MALSTLKGNKININTSEQQLLDAVSEASSHLHQKLSIFFFFLSLLSKVISLRRDSRKLIGHSESQPPKGTSFALQRGKQNRFRD